jgi:hypothetical protein
MIEVRKARAMLASFVFDQVINKHVQEPEKLLRMILPKVGHQLEQ